MAIIKIISTSFLVAFLLASNVEAQSDLSLVTDIPACDNTAADSDALTTYEMLCDVDAAGVAVSSPVTKPDVTFETFCTLLRSGPWNTINGVVDIVDFLSDADGSHTLFAPTDDAFDDIAPTVNAVNALAATNPIQFGTIVSNWLQLHILPDTYLTSDFTCDQTYFALNLLAIPANSQRQQTRCRGEAATFAQIGGGNVGQISQPTVGEPSGVFALDGLDSSSAFPQSTTAAGSISSNVIACNGVLNIVNSVMIPGGDTIETKGGKGSKGYGVYGLYYGAKGGKGYGGYGRYGSYYGAKGAKGYGYGRV